MKSSARARRRRDPSFWKALNWVLGVLIVVAGLAFLAITFYPEIAKRDEMRRSLEAQKKELAAAQLLLKQREREAWLLENDKTYIETIARDKLGLMKDGETIYRFESVKTGTPEPAPGQ